MNAKRRRNYYDMFAIIFNSQKSYRKETGIFPDELKIAKIVPIFNLVIKH